MILIFSSDENSDLDICVITGSHASKSEKKRKIRYLLKGIGIAKDILTPISFFLLNAETKEIISLPESAEQLEELLGL